MRINLCTSRLGAAVVAVVLLSSPVVRAAAINYGDSPVIPPGVQFHDMTESSGTDSIPLFGAPDYFTTGVDFDPTSFIAHSTNGANDVTDGQLNFTLEGEVSGQQVVAFDSISLFEAGDYALVGTGTTATQVLAGVIMRVTVTEIDGVAPTGGPVTLTPANASVGFNLIANPGLTQPWGIGLAVNIDAQLAGLGYTFTYGATEIEVVIDNELLALSESGSIATIAKKDFAVTLESTATAVPEPATASVLALGFAGALLRRRGR